LNGKIGEDLRVASIATGSPITVEKSDSVAKARDLMVRKRFDHLPVMDGRRLEGMVTSTHLVARISPPERVGSKSMSPETRRPFGFPVGDVMETGPLACPAETSAQRALGFMLKGDRTYVLVTQWEELQGIATYRDFMALLAGPEPESEVPVFIVGLPDDPFEAEATKAKFRRTINQLRRVFPDILEARSVIKSKSSTPGKERRRYEVNVQIRTARESYTYSEEGWELPEVYDVITDRLKRLITQKQKLRRPRERENREEL
jgi:CBS domain-containing protein